MRTVTSALDALRAEPRGGDIRPHGSGSPRIAYIMSRFPKITETFVLFEMGAIEGLGARVDVFPLLRQPPGPRHHEAQSYEDRAHYVPLLSWEVLRANATRLARDPRGYLGVWWEVLWGTWGSLKFFAGAVVYYPKCVVFAERMEAMGVDHIHAHFANHPAMAAFAVHRLTGIPYSFTAHGSDLHVDRRMLREKVEAAAFVATVSAYNHELIVQKCGEDQRDKIVVIHCGTDPNVFDGRSARGGPENANISANGDGNGNGSRARSLRIACVASFEEVKGHRFLIQACGLLVERGVDVHLDLAGDGALRRDIVGRIADLGLTERVTIHGSIARPEVGRILAAADVAVLASHPTASGRREGIPVALMEAMMSGLPVVASRLSGIPELVDDGRTGFLVPSGDPRALADSLESLVDQPALRRRLGEAGRAKVETEFDLQEGARRLLAEINSGRTTERPHSGE